MQLHQLSLTEASSGDRDYIEKRPPLIEISYRDGTDYEIKDQATLKDVIPGKGKLLDSVKVSSQYGEFTGSIELKVRTSFEPVVIRAAGLEDKIGHFVENLVAELTRETDVTIFAHRIWPVLWAFVFASLIWLSLGWRRVHDWNSAYGLGLLILFSTIILVIPIGFFRDRWLPPVAFMWGEDGIRAKQARIMVTLVLATVPIGVLINGISALFLR